MLVRQTDREAGAGLRSHVGVQPEEDGQLEVAAAERRTPQLVQLGEALQLVGRLDRHPPQRRPGRGLVDGGEQVRVGLPDALEGRPAGGDAGGAGTRPLPEGDDVGAPSARGQHLGDGREVVGLERVLPHPRVREGHLDRGRGFGQRGHVDDVEGGPELHGRGPQPLSQHVDRPASAQAARQWREESRATRREYSIIQIFRSTLSHE